MEFKVETNLSTIQPRAIQSNVGEVKQWLQTSLQKFRQMIVEEGEIQSAKSDLANIRKIKKTISDQRIFVKKEFMVPFTEWENQVKELEGLCDEAIANIDTQVKNFDSQKKAEKRQKLLEYFDSCAKAAKVEEFVSFETIENPKWMNEGYKLATAMSDVKTAVAETLEDVRTIYNQNSEFETALLDDYRNTHDLRKVLAKNQYLYDLKEREATRRNQVSPKPLESSQKETPSSDEGQKEKPAPAGKPKRYNVLLALEMTAQQMRDLSAYLKQNEIKVLQSKHKEITK